MSAVLDSIYGQPLGVYLEVALERSAQDQKWGQQNHPDLGEAALANQLSREMFSVFADSYKASNDAAVKAGTIDWTGILLEEVYEALAEEDTAKLREELVQSAAVIVAWIEAIDRRKHD